MAKARAIVKRLKTVKNIRKITRTMELIATARFKRAMDRATEAAEYTRKISEIVADLSASARQRGVAGFTHPLLNKHSEEKNAILLSLNSNRGFNGGYNGSIIRMVIQALKRFRADDVDVRLEVSGRRGLSLLRFQGYPPDETFTNFEDRPGFDEVNVLAERYIRDYIAGKIDRLDVAYMRFDSSSRQTPVIETLLPIGVLPGVSRDAESAEPSVDYEFLPSPTDILEEIVPAAFKARLFKCFLDAAVSDQIFRMVAMKGATENADEMITDLSRQYNRARQTQITSELSEIIGGAAALEG